MPTVCVRRKGTHFELLLCHVELILVLLNWTEWTWASTISLSCNWLSNGLEFALLLFLCNLLLLLHVVGLSFEFNLLFKRLVLHYTVQLLFCLFLAFLLHLSVLFPSSLGSFHRHEIIITSLNELWISRELVTSIG